MFKSKHLGEATHVAGKDNDMVDSLSGLQMDHFYQLFPDADQVRIFCPPHLWDLI